ncbi:hypothetical protein EV182_002728 [Spiromyces aspiralis]|uniref:Uncharacterized protein n=1 Tax=Spiromyces aspiralis TaxID=68401 RepID=A0ACC1HH69_9FUNG|nr:hypothetical protein EV182_002728 [Spiromyces aspiralis]
MLVKPTYVQEVVDERWELSCTAEIVTDTLSGDVALVSCADATTMPALGSGDGKDRSSSRPSTDSSSGGSNIFGDILREKVKQRDNALTSICDLVGEASPHYTLGGSRPDSVVIMSEGSFSTSFKPLNGMTVIWEDESTTFIVPESQLAFIRFSICNSSGDTVATTTLSIEALKQGYRYIYLEFNRSGSNGKRSTEVPNVHVVSLFTHIEIMELHSTNHRCTCGKHIHHSRCHSRRASSVSSTSLSLTTTATKKT